MAWWLPDLLFPAPTCGNRTKQGLIGLSTHSAGQKVTRCSFRTQNVGEKEEGSEWTHRTVRVKHHKMAS